MDGTPIMPIISIQKVNPEACAYLFKTKSEYNAWANSQTPDFTSVVVKLTALHGTEFAVDGVYINPHRSLWYAVRHYDTPRTYTIKSHAVDIPAKAIYYTSWVIPEPYYKPLG